MYIYIAFNVVVWPHCILIGSQVLDLLCHRRNETMSTLFRMFKFWKISKRSRLWSFRYRCSKIAYRVHEAVLIPTDTEELQVENATKWVSIPSAGGGEERNPRGIALRRFIRQEWRRHFQTILQENLSAFPRKSHC